MSDEHARTGGEHKAEAKPATILDSLSGGRTWLVFAVAVTFFSVIPAAVLALKIFSSSPLALPREYVPLFTTLLTALVVTACVIILVRFQSNSKRRSLAQEMEELHLTEKVLFEDLELDVANLTEQEPNSYGR
jgi:hypothetical protein